jgi:site-specific recombinase XerD
MNPIYKDTLNSFRKWLQTLGFAESTVYSSVGFTKDFFVWLENQGIKTLKQVSKTSIANYHKNLQKRENKRLGGGLSQNTISSHINALKRLGKYLQQTGKPFVEIELQLPASKEQHLNVLGQKEVLKLYAACENNLLGIRDKALLDIYYGCGLRRNEGIALNEEDVLLNEKLVHVRSGKGARERYVPITESLKDSLGNYMETTRKSFLTNTNSRENGLLVGVTGKRISGTTAINRIQQLASVARIEKRIGLHTLRHSIATHLLQSGMELEDVSRFLGHSSLESTQIYIHLSHEI